MFSSFRCFFLCVFLTLITLPSQAQFFNNKAKPLSEEEAFQVTAKIENGTIDVYWQIADDYYLYRDNFAIESNSQEVQIQKIEYPQGVIENDSLFGKVEVYFAQAELKAKIHSNQPKLHSVSITLKAQGCNKPIGICYPPMTRTLEIPVDANAFEASQPPSHIQATPEQKKPTNIEKSLFSILVSAFIAGLLLSFTPCVLPMIPILAGFLSQQSANSARQSGWLAICYVGGTITSYIAAGALAGATGAQLQAYFQNIWVIGFVCILLCLLAVSLFGAFKIQLPNRIQSAVQNTNISSRSASLRSYFLGLISALVVGACVSPVLIVALGAAISQGNPLLGALTMGFMALGMGVLLIAFGFGADWILPKTGSWMTHIQSIFAFFVLGVAIYLLDNLSVFSTLYLWSALFICAGFYLQALSKLVTPIILRSVLQTAACIALIWGAIALIGELINDESKQNTILRPLSTISTTQGIAADNTKKLPFEHTTTLSQVQQLLHKAKQNKQAVMLDFYADWCLDCKRMQKTTYRKTAIHNALKDWLLIEVDVTQTNAQSQAVKKHFSVFGPPATLFFDVNGEEKPALRRYGYLTQDALLALIKDT